VHYRKQLWGVCHYVVLSLLWEVTVGHRASGRLHVTEYVFPDECVKHMRTSCTFSQFGCLTEVSAAATDVCAGGIAVNISLNGIT